LSLSAILMFYISQIKSSVLMKMSKFESLMNLWWSFSFLLSDKVEDSRWEWALKVELNWLSSWVLISIFWLNSSTWYQSSDLTQILDINLLTWLKYSISTFWLSLILISSQYSIWVFNSTHQEIENDIKRVKYRTFSDFSPLHYLFDRKS